MCFVGVACSFLILHMKLNSFVWWLSIDSCHLVVHRACWCLQLTGEGAVCCPAVLSPLLPAQGCAQRSLRDAVPRAGLRPPSTGLCRDRLLFSYD